MTKTSERKIQESRLENQIITELIHNEPLNVKQLAVKIYSKNPRQCPKCKGERIIDYHSCERCKGTGTKPVSPYPVTRILNQKKYSKAEIVIIRDNDQGRTTNFFAITTNGVMHFLKNNKLNIEQFWKILFTLALNEHRFVMRTRKTPKNKTKTYQKYKGQSITKLNKRKFGLNYKQLIQFYEEDNLRLLRKYSPIPFFQFFQKTKIKKLDTEIIDYVGKNRLVDSAQIFENTSASKQKGRFVFGNFNTHLGSLVNEGLLISESFPSNDRLVFAEGKYYRIPTVFYKYQITQLGLFQLCFFKKTLFPLEEIRIKNPKLLKLIFEDKRWIKLKKLNVDIKKIFILLSEYYFGNKQALEINHQQQHIRLAFQAQPLLDSFYRYKYSQMSFHGKIALRKWIAEKGLVRKLEKSLPKSYKNFIPSEYDAKLFILTDSLFHVVEDIRDSRILKTKPEFADAEISADSIPEIFNQLYPVVAALSEIEDFNNEHFTTHKLDAGSVLDYDPTILDSISNTIQFHFYLLLQTKILENTWKTLMSHDPVLKKWYFGWANMLIYVNNEFGNELYNLKKFKTRTRHDESESKKFLKYMKSMLEVLK